MVKNKRGETALINGAESIYVAVSGSGAYQIFLQEVLDPADVDSSLCISHGSRDFRVVLISRTIHHVQTAPGTRPQNISDKLFNDLAQAANTKIGEAEDVKIFRVIPAINIADEDDDAEENPNLHTQAGAGRPIPKRHAAPTAFQRPSQDQLRPEPPTRKFHLSSSPLINFNEDEYTNEEATTGGGAAGPYGDYARVDPKYVKVPALKEDRSKKRDSEVDIRNFCVDLDGYSEEVKDYTSIVFAVLPIATILYNLRSRIEVPAILKALRTYSYNTVSGFLQALEAIVFPGQNSRKFADWISFTEFQTDPEKLTQDLTAYEVLRTKIEKLTAEEIHGLNLLKSIKKNLEPHQLTAVLTRVGGKFLYPNAQSALEVILADKINAVATAGDHLFYADNQKYPYRPNDRGPSGGGGGWHYNRDGTWDWNRPRGGKGKGKGERDHKGGRGRGKERDGDKKGKGRKRSHSQGSQSSSSKFKGNYRDRSGSRSRATSTEKIDM
eukprot:g9415.t1